MSFYSIPNNLPQHFEQQPPYIAVPLTRTQHMTQQQILTNSSPGTLTPSQLLAPIVLNLTSTTGAFTLPPAYELATAFGNFEYYNPTNHFHTKAWSQVQVGDVFVVPVIQLATNAFTGTFSPAAGSTGGKGIGPYIDTTAPYGYGSNPNSLVIQFTNLTWNQYSYTLQ